MTKPIRAAIYARVSDPKQVEKSGLAVQVAECRKYADGSGFEVVAEYRDEGISGAHGINYRDALDQTLTAARARKFDVLLVYNLDRLARELGVGMMTLGEIANSGVLLIEAVSGNAFDSNGALHFLVKLWAADDDRKKILTRTKHGQIERAKQGRVSGPAPFGYDKDAEGRLVINEEEAEVVRSIYHLYLNEGHYYDSLATLLNAQGIKTKRAKLNEAGKNRFRGTNHWQRSTIKCVLTNPVYKGTYVYGKTFGRVRDGKEYEKNDQRPLTDMRLATALKNREFMPHERVEREVPAIIEADAWEQVQAEIASRAGRLRARKAGKKYSYTFNGIVRCAHCGRLMTKTTLTGNRKDGSVREIPYYVCRNKENECPNVFKHHRISAIDDEIIRRLVPYLNDPGLVRKGLEQQLGHQQQQHDELVSKLQGAEKRIGELQKQIDNLVDGLAAGAITAAQLREHRQKRETEIGQLEREAAAVRQQLDDLGFTEDNEKVEAVIQLFEKLRATHPKLKLAAAVAYGWEGEADENLLVSLAQNLVKRVSVDVDSRIVEYVLRIKPTPPDDDSKSNHRAKRKCMTSPSFTS